MRAGGRSCLAKIWRLGDSDASGEPSPPPVLDREVWCSIIPVRAREPQLGGERVALVTYTARLDYLDGQGLDETMIVEFEGTKFGIVGVLVDFTTQKTVDLQLSEQRYGA